MKNQALWMTSRDLGWSNVQRSSGSIPSRARKTRAATDVNAESRG